jgi:hypothetical protein
VELHTPSHPTLKRKSTLAKRTTQVFLCRIFQTGSSNTEKYTDICLLGNHESMLEKTQNGIFYRSSSFYKFFARSSASDDFESADVRKIPFASNDNDHIGKTAHRFISFQHEGI